MSDDSRSPHSALSTPTTTPRITMADQAKSVAGAKDPKQQTYREWAGQKYNQQYESWMPWVEDKYLSWFTKDNKTSYATKREYPSPPIPTSCARVRLLPKAGFDCVDLGLLGASEMVTLTTAFRATRQHQSHERRRRKQAPGRDQRDRRRTIRQRRPRPAHRRRVLEGGRQPCRAWRKG